MCASLLRVFACSPHTLMSAARLQALERHGVLVGECKRLQNAVLAHTRVDVMAVEMGRSEFRTNSTVGIMLNDCVIDTLVVGGPAFNSRQIRPGAMILKIDGKLVSPENITTHLIGVDIPGSEVMAAVCYR